MSSLALLLNRLRQSRAATALFAKSLWILDTITPIESERALTSLYADRVWHGGKKGIRRYCK